MKYVMITDFRNHWDKLKNGFTSFPRSMLTQGIQRVPIVSGTETVFIKKNECSGQIEQSWIGKVWDIQFLSGKVYFRVEIENRMECPAEYAGYPNGWYFYEKVLEQEPK